MSDLSSVLGLSESTAHRALRVLVRNKRAVRSGCAHATRYQARRRLGGGAERRTSEHDG